MSNNHPAPGKVVPEKGESGPDRVPETSHSASRLAFRVVAIYVIVSALWILISDRLVAVLVSDPQMRVTLSVLKGWGFVAATAAILYFMLKGESSHWAREQVARGQAASAMRLHAERQRLLLEAARKAWETTEREHELSIGLMAIIGPHVEADSCFHYRLSEEKQRLELIAAIGVPPQASPRIQEIDLKVTFTGKSVARKETVVADYDDIHALEEAAPVRIVGGTALVAIPLMARDGRVLGALTYVARKKRKFSTEEVALLELVGRFAAFATERIRAMTELKESEARYRLLAENTADVIWVLDVATRRFLYVSPSVLRLRGYTAEESMQVPLSSAMTRESYEKVETSLHERLALFEAGRPEAVTQVHELEQIRRDGTTVWTEVVTTLLRVPDGLRIVGVTRDITERRKMEQKIRAQELLLRETTELAHIGGWEFDPVTGAGVWTEETARIHDLDPREQIDVSKGLSYYKEEYRPLIAAAVREAVDLGTPYDLELQILTAAGRTKWVRTTGHPIVENGKVIRMRGTMQDVTLKKRAELFAEGQKKVLERIVDGRPLAETLEFLVRLTEAQCDGMLCAVMLVDEGGTRLVNGCSPGLPAAYVAAVDGIEIGPAVGSCGTAAYRKEAVIVEDVLTDPLWQKFRDLALAHGIRACWSTPIFGDQREVLGTLALYFHTPRKLDNDIQRVIDLSTHTASVALNRARFEKVLQASEAQFRAVVESAPDAIFIQVDGKFAYANPATVRLFATKDSGQIVGRPVYDFLHPDCVEKARKRIALVNEKRVVAPLAVQRFVGQDKTVKDAEVSAVPFLFRGKHGALVFARDVTERKKAEERLNFHQAILRETGHIAKVGGWQYNVVKNESYWTEETACIHDLDGADAVLPEKGVQFYEPPFRQRIEEAFGEAVRRGIPYDLELLLVTAKGRRKWVRTIGHPVMEDGKVVLVRGSFQDITEKKQAEAALRESEARFRQVVENIEVVFYVSDPVTNRVQYISPAYEKIWGRPVANFTKDPTRWIETVHEEDRARVVAALPHQAEGGYAEIYRILRPDGKVRWIQDRAFPVKNDEGKVYCVVGTATDITESRNLEEQLRQAQKMEAIGTLAGGIAHDFNNILGAIMGYTDLAKIEVKSDSTLASLDEVMKACRRAGDLVRQILAFSRQQEFKRLPLQLWRIVDEAVRLLRAAIPATIEFDVVLDKHAPTVLADATQIHQVIMNLCTNAAHAMAGRPGVLTVRLEPFNADWDFARVHPGGRVGHYAKLTVADNGIGMDAATLERIYEPFFTTKKPGEGTGLGLSVVHGVVQNHDGVITVQSAPGQGTAFTLYFPAYVGAEPEPNVDVETVPRGNGEKILVVEDEEQLARMTGAILSRLGYRADLAANPQEALNRLRSANGDYQLVLTDLTMPGMTGVDLAGVLAKMYPQVPLILMTGYFSRQNHDLIEAAGIKEVLLKPIELRKLAETVRRVMHHGAVPVK